jgi:hypothetical protein
MITDAASLLAGGGLLATGALLGSWITAHTAVVRRRVAKPLCSCDHPPALHSPETGECQAEVIRDKHNKYGEWMGHEYVPCRCMRYDGPIPVEQYLGQRLTLPHVDQ